MKRGREGGGSIKLMTAIKASLNVETVSRAAVSESGTPPTQRVIGVTINTMQQEQQQKKKPKNKIKNPTKNKTKSNETQQNTNKDTKRNETTRSDATSTTTTTIMIYLFFNQSINTSRRRPFFCEASHWACT